jgi:tRNA nucleotidyltransferase (CCA-adding enzyme)
MDAVYLRPLARGSRRCGKDLAARGEAKMLTPAGMLRYSYPGMNEQEYRGLARNLHAWEKSLLEVCDLYLVGGTVRDMLLGTPESSLDDDYLVAGIEVGELVSRLGRFGKLNLVGKSFGVIKFTPPSDKTVDVSLPRTEFSTGVGHRDFSVQFDPQLPIEKDLERRDYTINSMALHLGTGSIVDPLGGKKDLENRLLRVNRRESFFEDPLRILRGIQFMARFGLTVEKETSDLMRLYRELLRSIAPERVREELNKMLVLAEKPSRGFLCMHNEGILELILPELDSTYGEEQNEYHPDDVFMHSLKTCDLAKRELHLRWSALLHDVGKKEMKKVVDGRTVFYRHEEESARVARDVLERLRYPRELQNKVASLIEHHMFNITEEWSDSAVRRFMVRAGENNLDDLLALREADGLSRGDASVKAQNEMIRARFERVLASEAALKIKDLAVGGREVMETLGIGPSPEVGEILQKLLEVVLENPEYNTRERLTELVRDFRKKN